MVGPMYQQQPQWGEPGYGHTIEIKPPSRTPWVLTFLVLCGAAGAGYWGFQERGRLMSRAVGAEVAASNAETARKALDEQVKTLESERNALVAAKDALTKSVEEKSNEISELKGTYDKLQDKMKDEIAHGDVLLTASGGRLRVDLVDKVLFESGDATISKRGEAVLSKVGAVLASIDDKQIQVSGHTDNNPISDKLKTQYPTNWELSVARATNVVRFLQEKANVPPEHMQASGSGEFQPVASNKNVKGRARNRRIEILLLPSLAPKRISRGALAQKAADTAAEKPEKPQKSEKPHKAVAGRAKHR
jgi:chemotaxis protein MotB